MTRFKFLFNRVITALESTLPAQFVYHDVRHTKYVLNKTEYLARKEHIADSDLLLLKIAALYHDTGFMISKDGHERLSCELVATDMQEVGFSMNEIQFVRDIIMATHIPQRPGTITQKILADADLEYLSSGQYNYISEKLYAELKYDQPGLSRGEWNEIQVRFITAHRYHTNYFRKFREHLKLKNLIKIQAYGVI